MTENEYIQYLNAIGLRLANENEPAWSDCYINENGEKVYTRITEAQL